MRTFKAVAAQGEITIIRLPNRRKAKGNPLPTENGKLVIGHSETGHHHVLEHTRGASVTVLDNAPAGMRILRAILSEPNALIHERGFDTHDPIALDAGVYEFRIAREFDPFEELIRQSAD